MIEGISWLVVFVCSCVILAVAVKADDRIATEQQLAVPVALPFEKVLPGVVSDYEIMTAGGAWVKEYLLETRKLPGTGFRYVQDRGRGASMMKPWLSVRNTRTGQGVSVLMAYSGNWVMEVQPRDGKTVLRVDTSPSGHKAFAEFGGMPVPGALVAAFTGDWDRGAQPLVRFIRSKLLRDLGPDWPPVQYNTWYDNSDKLTEKHVLESARIAAAVGCELFTVDAGWYGTGVNADWSAGLGTWEVNRERFPNGLEAVAHETRRLGMKFGLWIEIECAAPASPVLQKHPDWVLRDGDRQLSPRAAIDFGNQEVVAWAKSVIDRLVTTYSLDYIKMDFNVDLPVDGQRLTPQADPLYRHYRGLVELWAYMRKTYPKLIVENCASGSLREDAMTAALTDTHWVSDEVANPANLAMNYGATYMFPPEICNHWTTMPGKPNAALDRHASFTANMLGHMGLSGKISEWDADTLKVVAERIAFYKKIRPHIRCSDVYHLTSQINAAEPRSMQAALYVDPASGKAILFAFQGGDPSLEHSIVLHGLQADRSYLLRMPEGYGRDRTVSGKVLAKDGFVLRFSGTGAAAVIMIEPL